MKKWRVMVLVVVLFGSQQVFGANWTMTSPANNSTLGVDEEVFGLGASPSPNQYFAFKMWGSSNETNYYDGTVGTTLNNTWGAELDETPWPLGDAWLFVYDSSGVAQTFSKVTVVSAE
jgi:hypothetical protein